MRKSKQLIKKIEQNKAEYDLDRQTANISALLSGNVSKYEILTGNDVLLEKDLLEKAATMIRFEYLPLQADITKKLSRIRKNLLI